MARKMAERSMEGKCPIPALSGQYRRMAARRPPQIGAAKAHFRRLLQASVAEIGQFDGNSQGTPMKAENAPQTPSPAFITIEASKTASALRKPPGMQHCRIASKALSAKTVSAPKRCTA
jgi:hypothetical protein